MSWGRGSLRIQCRPIDEVDSTNDVHFTSGVRKRTIIFLEKSYDFIDRQTVQTGGQKAYVYINIALHVALHVTIPCTLSETNVNGRANVTSFTTTRTACSGIDLAQ